jgi:hypothetical protein
MDSNNIGVEGAIAIADALKMNHSLSMIDIRWNYIGDLGAEAIADAVKPGCDLYLEGFTHLISFAAGHEIIRQGIKDLTAIRLTPDLVYDQLIEAGLVKKLVFSWAGNPGVGSLHALRRRSQKDSATKIELEESRKEHEASFQIARKQQDILYKKEMELLEEKYNEFKIAAAPALTKTRLDVVGDVDVPVFSVEIFVVLFVG